MFVLINFAVRTPKATRAARLDEVMSLALDELTSALVAAAVADQSSTAAALLRAGACADSADARGVSALQAARIAGDQSILHLLQHSLSDDAHSTCPTAPRDLESSETVSPGVEVRCAEIHTGGSHE